MTEADNIYWHMLEHGSINTREALKLYGCTKLKKAIKELNERGVKTVVKKVRVACDNGMQTIVLQYSIEGEDYE